MADKEVLELILETVADIRDAVDDMNEGFDKIQKDGQRSAEELEKSYTDAFKTIGQASAIAFAGITAGAGFLIHEAAQGEASLNKVGSAVRLNGGDWKLLRGEITNTTSALQRHTRYADDELNTVLARMIFLTGKVEESYKNLNLVTDVAAALQIDLGSAGDIVAKGMQGQLGMLSRYMPELEKEIEKLGEGASAAEKKAVIIDRLKKFTGAASDDTKTFSGEVDQLKNEFKDTAKALGEALLPVVKEFAEKVKPLAQDISDWAKEHPNLSVAITGTGLVLTGFVASLATIVSALPTAIKYTKQFSDALTTLQTRNPYLLAVIVGLGAAYTGYKYLGEAMTSTIKTQTDLQAIADKYNHGLGETKEGLRITANYLQIVRNQMTGMSGEWTDKNEAAWQEFLQSLEDANTYGPTAADVVANIGKEGKITAQQLKIDAAGLRDLMNAGLDFKEAFKLSRMPVLPEQTIEASADESPETIYGVTLDEWEEYFSGMSDAEKDYWGIPHEKQAEETQRQMDVVTKSIRDNWASSWETVIMSSDSANKKIQSIGRSLASSLIRNIADVAAQHIFAEHAKTAVTISATRQAVASSTTAAATEQANARATTAGWLGTAFAKLTAFYAFSGPLAPVLAFGTISAAFAALTLVMSRALRFQQGGIIPGSGFGDKVPFLGEPGERVISRDEYSANAPAIERAIRGQGNRTSGNVIQVFADKRLSIAEVIEIEQLFERWFVPRFEKAMEQKQFRPGYARYS